MAKLGLNSRRVSQVRYTNGVDIVPVQLIYTAIAEEGRGESAGHTIFLVISSDYFEYNPSEKYPYLKALLEKYRPNLTE